MFQPNFSDIFCFAMGLNSYVSLPEGVGLLLYDTLVTGNYLLKKKTSRCQTPLSNIQSYFQNEQTPEPGFTLHHTFPLLKSFMLSGLIHTLMGKKPNLEGYQRAIKTEAEKKERASVNQELQLLPWVQFSF